MKNEVVGVIDVNFPVVADVVVCCGSGYNGLVTAEKEEEVKVLEGRHGGGKDEDGRIVENKGGIVLTEVRRLRGGGKEGGAKGDKKRATVKRTEMGGVNKR